MKKIRQTISKFLHKFNKRTKDQKLFHSINHIFSFTLSDCVFDFYSTSISEIKTYLRKTINIEVDEIIIYSLAHIQLHKNPLSHQAKSETILRVIEKNGKFIAILLLTEFLRQDRYIEKR